MAMRTNVTRLVATVERGEGEGKTSHETHIGFGSEDREGNITLSFYYLPADLSRTTIQLRPYVLEE